MSKVKTAKIISLNISTGGIPKRPVPSIRVTFSGFEGDGHNHAKHNSLLQAICLQDLEEIQRLNTQGYSLTPGMAGENLTVENLDVNHLPIGTQLQFSGGVCLEISKVRKPCYVMDSIDIRLKDDALNHHGMYAKVVCEGVLTVGENMSCVHPKSL